MNPTETVIDEAASHSQVDSHAEALKSTKKPYIKLQETPTQLPSQVEIQHNNQYVVQSSPKCVIEGAPTTMLNRQSEQVSLERVVYVQDKMHESISIESQPQYSIVHSDQVHVEHTPAPLQSIVIENSFIQQQPKIEIQRHNEVTIQGLNSVQTQNHSENVQIQQLPSVHLEHHSKIELQHQNNLVLENTNLSTHIERAPETAVHNKVQNTSTESSPQTNLEENQNNHQIQARPNVDTQYHQEHQIENKPIVEIHQQVQQSNTEIRQQVEIQQNDEAHIEQKQELKVEGNQQNTQLVIDEEKVIVTQMNQTNIENQPTHENVNIEQQGTIERRPRLQTQRDTNPVEVSHNDFAYIQKDEQIEKQNHQDEEKIIEQIQIIPQQRPNYLKPQKPNQEVAEEFKPQNDAEEQFLNAQVQKDVGVLGLSVAAAALTSSLIFKNTLNSRNGALAVLAGSAALFAGYKLTHKL